MFRYILVGLFTVAVLVVGFETVKAEEEEVKLSECPKAVQKTLTREATGGKIVEIEKELEDGDTVYEAEIIIDGNEYEVEVAEDGTLLSKILEDEEDEDAEDEGEEDEEDGDDEDDDDDDDEDEDDDDN